MNNETNVQETNVTPEAAEQETPTQETATGVNEPADKVQEALPEDLKVYEPPDNIEPVVEASNLADRDLTAEWTELAEAHPEVVGKPLPEDIFRACTSGGDGRTVLQIYESMTLKNQNDELERLRTESAAELEKLRSESSAEIEKLRTESQAEIERLKAENALLRQNAENAAHAPVFGVSGGGAPLNEADDPFLTAFKAYR